MGSLAKYGSLDIDWNLAPEDAVTLYLEWGNNSWKGQFQPVRSKSDYSNYFVVNTWGERPKVYLIRRNSEEARELAELEIPERIAGPFLESIGHLKGIHQPTTEIRKWLESELDH